MGHGTRKREICGVCLSTSADGAHSLETPPIGQRELLKSISVRSSMPDIYFRMSIVRNHHPVLPSGHTL